MPLENPDLHLVRRAEGYAELGMWLDANSCLEEVDPFNRAAPEVLAVRLKVYRGLKKWELMHIVAQKLADFDPENLDWLLGLAFATRRGVSTEVARTILLKALSKFRKEAVIYFHLACYECELNRLDSAKAFLKQAFTIDPRYRELALDDLELEPVWKHLSEQ